MFRYVVSVVCSITLAGCAAQPQGFSERLSKTEEAAIIETMHGVMRDFVGSWAKVTCEDQAPFLRFFDLSAPGLIDSDGETVTEYPGNAWPAFIQKGACGRVREEGTLDSLLVRVLSRDIVSVSWTYHGTYYEDTGTNRRIRGTVLQVFRRTANGWKTPVGMSSHIPIAPE